jgi:hypothetical protein
MYFGQGRFLESLSHIHVLTGVLLIAAYAERMLLYVRRGLLPVPPRRIRTPLMATLIASGVLLIAPTITPMLDEFIPALRVIHRVCAGALTLWTLWALTTR